MAYLDRLGVGAESPSFEALRELHRRQVERVSYETLWIHAGEAWDIDPHRSVERIALQGRGGYCYHLNGAFAELLSSLGYAVTRHVGSVHAPGMDEADSVANHVVLMVSDLPTDEHPSGVWYVDAGLGDALHEPLPLAAGKYQQEPFRLILDAPSGSVHAWHLTHDPTGGFASMRWETAEVMMDVFTERHQWLSTSPDSGFVRVAMAERRDATGVDVIRGLVLTRIGVGARSHEPLTKREDWFDALADVFDLRFDASTPEAVDQLWERVLAGHRAWEAAQLTTTPGP
jgi:N-hydroxyarylamine O-acetyltransferase